MRKPKNLPPDAVLYGNLHTGEVHSTRYGQKWFRELKKEKKQKA